MLADTGFIIKTYLESNGKTFEDLVKASNLSTRTVYRIVNSENKLPYDIAKAVNKLIPEITVEFLMAYDAKYQAQKRQAEEQQGIKNIEEIIKKFRLKKLFPEIKDNKQELINKAINVFGKESLNQGTVSTSWMFSCNFSEANNANDFDQKIWLSTVYHDCKNNNDLLDFDKSKVIDSIDMIKELSGTSNKNITLFNMKKIASNCGVNFCFRKSIPNSRIKAVTIKDRDGYVYIFMSDLFKCIENMWLSFMHEFIHILKEDYNNSFVMCSGDIKKHEDSIDNEVIERFLGNAEVLVDINTELIAKLSKENNVPESIIAEIARISNRDYQSSTLVSFLHFIK